MPVNIATAPLIPCRIRGAIVVSQSGGNGGETAGARGKSARSPPPSRLQIMRVRRWRGRQTPRCLPTRASKGGPGDQELHHSSWSCLPDDTLPGAPAGRITEKSYSRRILRTRSMTLSPIFGTLLLRVGGKRVRGALPRFEGLGSAVLYEAVRIDYAIAREGALKMQGIRIGPSEGYPAAELRYSLMRWSTTPRH